MRVNKQSSHWSGDFGTKYIERNYFDTKELDRQYKKVFGITRTELNEAFIGKLNRNIKILEVGCNVGNQLLLLQQMGFKNLYGIEINKKAVEAAQKRTKDSNIINGLAQDIPFKEGFFDLVFTAGVLIHINPKDIKKVMSEMYRCASKYIWGYESYSDKYEKVNYREKNNLYWKTDFSELFIKNFSKLKLKKKKMIKYLDNKNFDFMYLLKKEG